MRLAPARRRTRVRRWQTRCERDQLLAYMRRVQRDLGLTVRSDKGVVIFYCLPGGGGGSLGVVRAGISAAANPPSSAAQAGVDTTMICLLTTYTTY